MNVLPGPTFTIDDDGTQNQKDGSVHRVVEPPQLWSESSSSIGTPDDSGEDEEQGEEAVESMLNPRIGLDSLEESLPIKKGLSGHFDGKSKSFTDLSQVTLVKELQKQENPFNKRRRVLMASRWSRRSSFYYSSNPKSMPLLPLHEDDEHEEEEEEEKCRKLPSPSSSLSSSSSSSFIEDQILLRRRQKTAPESRRLGPGSFKFRSFSLADLKEHDEEEGEEEKDA